MHNQKEAVIYNTYQCYLKVSLNFGLSLPLCHDPLLLSPLIFSHHTDPTLIQEPAISMYQVGQCNVKHVCYELELKRFFAGC